MAEAFEKIVAGLSDEHKAEFYKILNEAGITRDDVALVKLLHALQLYKAYYAEIPDSVLKTVSEMKKVKTEIEELASQAAQCAQDGETTLNHLRQETSQVNDSLTKLHSHVEEAANKASAIVSKRMTTLLTEAMKTALPLSDLAEAGKTFAIAVNSGKEASADLRANIKDIKLAHWGAYACAAVFTIIGLFGFLHYRYERLLDAERKAVVFQVEENRDVLLSLARLNRTLELSTNKENPKHILLSVKDATGWTSKNRQGVIEIQD